jgi:hypothetical protein
LYESYLDATPKPHSYFLLDLAQDTDDRLRLRTNIFPSEITVVYAPVGDERIRSNYHLLQALKKASPRLRKAILENSDRDVVLGIAELALNVLNGNCKISRSGAERLRKHKTVLRRLVDRGSLLQRRGG